MAKKWIPIVSEAPEQALEQDFAAAEQVGKLSVGKQYLFHPKLLGGVDYLAFADIQRAYRRQEESRAVMGCCPQYFLTHFLVTVLPDGTPKKWELERKEQVDRALELLKERAPEIAFGFVKKAE
ncbi:MAG: hypothetical protein ACI3VN_03615 [Candidatus Onthomonas sp.]